MQPTKRHLILNVRAMDTETTRLAVRRSLSFTPTSKLSLAFLKYNSSVTVQFTITKVSPKPNSNIPAIPHSTRPVYRRKTKQREWHVSIVGTLMLLCTNSTHPKWPRYMESLSLKGKNRCADTMMVLEMNWKFRLERPLSFLGEPCLISCRRSIRALLFVLKSNTIHTLMCGWRLLMLCLPVWESSLKV